MSNAAEHKRKVKIARRLRPKSELYAPLFGTSTWLTRKAQIAERVRRHNIRAKYYKELKEGVR